MKLKADKQKQQINYWLPAAEKDLPVIDHLFEKGDYHYALFFWTFGIGKNVEGA